MTHPTPPTPEALALAERYDKIAARIRKELATEITRLMQPRAQSGGEVIKALDALDKLLIEQCWKEHLPEDYIETLRAALTGGMKWRPIEEWNEDDGEAFWTKFPVDEPYYAGSPLDTDWPGYHTHWISMRVLPTTPPADGERV